MPNVPIVGSWGILSDKWLVMSDEWWVRTFLKPNSPYFSHFLNLRSPILFSIFTNRPQEEKEKKRELPKKEKRITVMKKGRHNQRKTSLWSRNLMVAVKIDGYTKGLFGWRSGKVERWKIFSFPLYVFGWRDEKVEGWKFFFVWLKRKVGG